MSMTTVRSVRSRGLCRQYSGPWGGASSSQRERSRGQRQFVPKRHNLKFENVCHVPEMPPFILRTLV